MSVSELKDKALRFPSSPGVYHFFDEQGKILYIGKAKDLKKRVLSYFSKQTIQAKTQLLLSKSSHISYVLVSNEYEALLLENNLIKQHRPPYNILLKDDKTYPWICIKKEPFPRVFHTRKPVKDGSLYIGPYASVRKMHNLLDLIRQLFPIRTCSLPLSPKNIAGGKFKRCLEYHIGNCKAPCEGLQNEAEYMAMIEQVKQILKGHLSEVKQYLKQEIEKHSERLAFEEAHALKQKAELLADYHSKATVVSIHTGNVEVISIVREEKQCAANYLRVVEGALVHSHSLSLPYKLDESDAELLDTAIFAFRKRFDSSLTEIIVPFLPETELPEIVFTLPQRGDKKKLLELSMQNARQFLLDKIKHDAEKKPAVWPILTALQKDMRLPELPIHMECFDNSNMQGSFPVAACVVFVNGKPAKKMYRHFSIKTVAGPNDFASMEEVVYRRYKRMLDEHASLPQLVIIDGGKGQLSSAYAALKKLGLENKIRLAGIAKRLEEIYFYGESLPLYMNKRSPALKLIQHMRNEAHRFGITHHRKKRNRDSMLSELDTIKGIGPVGQQLLIAHFRTISGIKAASEEELAKVLGQKKAGIVREFFEKI